MKTLIIKLDAAGDVVRTTPLLHVLEGDVFWVTRQANISLLPAESGVLKKVIDIREAEEALQGEYFDSALG